VFTNGLQNCFKRESDKISEILPPQRSFCPPFLKGELIKLIFCDSWSFTSLHPEDGGSTVFRNVYILSQRYTGSQLRRPCLENSLFVYLS